MGAKNPAADMAGALFGKTRRAVLGLLYARPDETFYLRQIADVLYLKTVLEMCYARLAAEAARAGQGSVPGVKQADSMKAA